MDSRERVYLALNHEEPDRVPTDFWMSGGLRRKLEAKLGMTRPAFLDAHDIDLRYIDGPAYVGPPLRTLPDGSQEDIWGVPRRAVSVSVGDGAETYHEVAAYPLAAAKTVEDIEAYPHWPRPEWLDYRMIEAQCDAVRAQGRIAVFMGDRLNRIAQLKPAMYLRGIDQILVDMAAQPEIARAILGRIRDFYCDYAERILDAANGKLDIVLTGDDFGAQNAPLLSPRMWANFIGDGFERYCRLASRANVKVMHHTCGSVRPIIPLMVERGLDILQSLQPEAANMDLRAIKVEFGDRLCFQGGISIQHTLPFGAPADIREEVKDRVQALAPGGGYILGTAHNIQADTSVENVHALLKAYRELGRYG
jgi:uroporphyrinogen decarboxylase